MNSFPSDMNTPAEHAQHWVRRLPNATHEEREAFALWLKASPHNIQSYLQMLAVEREFQGFDAGHEIDVERLIARARDNVTSLGLYRSPDRSPSAAKRAGAVVTRWTLAAVFAGLAVIGGLYGAWRTSGLQEYSTRTGQQQQFKLGDGSIVNLNAETTVRVKVTANRRDVYLVSGEALFDVRHDPGRPFRVHVDGMTIEDVGTQFNIYKRTGATKISVIEGEVRVFQEPRSATEELLAPLFGARATAEPGYVPLTKPTPISAGKTASLTAKGREIRESALDLEQTTAWRQRMLVFHGTALAEIAAEFNRFNTEPKIKVDAARVANRTFSGIFRADDPKSFITFLQQETDLTVDGDGRAWVVTQP